MTQERRESDERLVVLEEGFRRHEKDCSERQTIIMTKLDSLSQDVATYKTSLKLLVGGVGFVVFVLQFFKEPIITWMR